MGPDSISDITTSDRPGANREEIEPRRRVSQVTPMEGHSGGYYTPLMIFEIQLEGDIHETSTVAVKQYGEFPDESGVPSTGEFSVGMAEKVKEDWMNLRTFMVNHHFGVPDIHAIYLVPKRLSLSNAASSAFANGLTGSEDIAQLSMDDVPDGGYRMLVIEKYVGDCVRTKIRKLSTLKPSLGVSEGQELETPNLGSDEQEIVREALLVLKHLDEIPGIEGEMKENFSLELISKYPEIVGIDSKPDNFVVADDEVFFVDFMPPRVDGEYATDPLLLELFKTNEPTHLKPEDYRKKLWQYYTREGRRDRFLEYFLKFLRHKGREDVYEEIIKQIPPLL